MLADLIIGAFAATTWAFCMRSKRHGRLTIGLLFFGGWVIGSVVTRLW